VLSHQLLNAQADDWGLVLDNNPFGVGVAYFWESDLTLVESA
jgi:hypothetical protein